MSKLTLNVGDVFAVPIDDSRVGVGQIVGTYGKDAYYFAIFASTASSKEQIDLAEAVAERVLLLALLFDAKLAAGHWTVVGNQPVRDDIPLPAFKEVVGSPDRVDVVDFTGERQ